MKKLVISVAVLGLILGSSTIAQARVRPFIKRLPNGSIMCGDWPTRLRLCVVSA